MTEQARGRLMAVTLGALVLASMGCVGAYWYVTQKNETAEFAASGPATNAGTQAAAVERAEPHRLNARFEDKDGDLIADVPADVGKQQDPAVLKFSHVGGDPNGNEQTWRELMAALEKTTGKKVEYLPAASVDEQMRQLRDGELQITLVNSGAVPLAVNECGYVPAYTLGRSGYAMFIIVPARSGMKVLEDLRGKELTLGPPKSNSGYRLPLVLLRKQGLEPGFGYRMRSGVEQKEAIAEIAAGKIDAAAVASDLLAREVAAGTIKEGEYRVIFKSPEYPQVAAGYAYNLKPELAKKIREGLEKFEWKGTGAAKVFGPSGQGEFVATDYKKDWAKVREVTDAMGDWYKIGEAGPTQRAGAD